MAFDFLELDTLRSVEELANYQKDVRASITTLNEERAGLPFNDEQRAEDKHLKETDQEIESRKTEIGARQSYIERMAETPNRTERTADFNVVRTAREQDIYDLSTIRSNFSDPDAASSELRERALRVAEVARFAFPYINRTEAKDILVDLIDTVHVSPGDDRDKVNRRIVTTASPVYGRAFSKAVQAKLNGTWPDFSREEQRALSLTGSAGGFAVPITIDPTIIGTSNGSVNPLRSISRIEKITGDEWRGVSSGAVTVAYAAEATETTDNAPTLAQPTISTEKAQAFIPFSIEIGMDWGGIQADLGRLLQEGKDDLEATKFFLGTGTNEPFGVIVGATNTITATTPQTMDAEDFYRLSAALPPRYQSRASIIANRAIYNLIRQFVLTGQSNPWKDLADPTSVEGRVGTLLGYPAYESSAMDATPATNNEIAIVGDFSRFVIVDRIGLDVEVMQHLVGTNHRPTGQRGLYAYFRNGSKVVDANAFRVLLGIV